MGIRFSLRRTMTMYSPKGMRIPTTSLRTGLGMTGGEWRRGAPIFTTPLAPLLGELSSVSETEGSPWLRDCQWGKEWSALRPVFSGLHRILPRRPLRRFAPLPLKGAALRGSEIDAAAQLTTVIPRRAKPDVGIRFSFTPRYDYTQSQGDADSHDQFENWSRNDRGWVEAGSADFYHALGAPLRGAVTVGD